MYEKSSSPDNLSFTDNVFNAGSMWSKKNNKKNMYTFLKVSISIVIS